MSMSLDDLRCRSMQVWCEVRCDPRRAEVVGPGTNDSRRHPGLVGVAAVLPCCRTTWVELGVWRERLWIGSGWMEQESLGCRPLPLLRPPCRKTIHPALRAHVGTPVSRVLLLGKSRERRARQPSNPLSARSVDQTLQGPRVCTYLPLWSIALEVVRRPSN